MNDWEAFEQAVAAFVKALDLSARVSHNIRLPDVDTGHPRQRDVWVETSFGGHFPITLLVSCKRTASKIDQQDVDAFVGELRSSGAHKGILYSYSGFTEPAIEKANRLGICCCRLYQNQAPDLPEVLTFQAYCNTERVRISLAGTVSPDIKTINDLFDLRVPTESGEQTVIHILATDLREKEVTAVRQLTPEAASPPNFASSITLPWSDGSGALCVRIEGGWKLYRAKVEAFLIRGSYSFTSKDFKGDQVAPWIDTWSPHPGPGWELLDPPPTSLEKGYVRIILHGAEVEKVLRQAMGRTSPVELSSRAKPPAG